MNKRTDNEPINQPTDRQTKEHTNKQAQQCLNTQEIEPTNVKTWAEVSICVYIHVYTYICVYIHIYTRRYACIHIHTPYIDVHSFTCVLSIYIYVYIDMHSNERTDGRAGERTDEGRKRPHKRRHKRTNEPTRMSIYMYIRR